MFDWLGSLRRVEGGPTRVTYGLSRGTRLVGSVLFAVGVAGALYAYPFAPMLALAPGLLGVLGLVLVTLRRRVTVDREAGMLTIYQSTLGIPNEIKFPLFHLRAVVVIAKPKRLTDGISLLPGSGRFVAYLDRRVGDVVYLDEARRCATLLKIAEEVAEVADVRLEYEAPAAL